MQLWNAASAIALGVERDRYYIYYGREGEIIPEDVTHVRIHSSVRVIEKWAFQGRGQLAVVILNDGLEEIGQAAFAHCTALYEIVMPNSVKTIQWGAFISCMGLTTVTLGNGLEEIGKEAFKWCTSLVHILIPTAVKMIHRTAFNGCSNLTRVQFCDEIENFVSCEAMREWWNQGLHEKSLSTYCFLVRCSVPERLGLVRVRSWRANIYDRLRSIPTISIEGINAYFNAIDSKLTLYYNLKDSPSLLELAVWKSKITERVDSNVLLTTEMKMQLCTDSISMVTIIVPNVLSFLIDSNGGNRRL